jgi:hypothetical protein
MGSAGESLFWRSFWNNATALLTAAENMPRDDDSPGLDVFVGYDGQIHLRMNSSAEPLASLQAHLGARMAYRVSRQDHCVRVEGRAGFRTCLFEAAKPDGAARFLLASRAAYQMAPDLQTRYPVPTARPASAWYS